METELITSNGTNLDLIQDIPISLNFSIADIRDPSKRNGAFSKTIKLPGTKKNNVFFEHLYEVNIATLNFNPNIKESVIIFQNSISVFEGYLRLMEVEQKMVNDVQEIIYHVSIFGENNDLFAQIGESKLENLDLSAYNHVYNRVNQEATWLATLGSGYVYPLIDYGYNNFLTNSFNVEHFRPAFFVKTYIDKIFSTAGKTYTSSFFNTTEFKRLIIPHNGDKFTMSGANLALYEFYAGDSGASTANTKSLTSAGSTYSDWWSGDLFSSTSTSYLLKWNDDTTLPFIDTGNRYDPSTGVFTVGQSGTYNFTVNADFELKVSSTPVGTATINLLNVNNTWVTSYKLMLSIDGGVTYNILNNNTPNFRTTVPSASYQTFAKTLNYSYTLNAGDKLKFHVHPLYSASGYGLVFKDGGGTPITAGTAAIDWRFRSTASVNVKLASSSFVSGQTLTVNDAIPKDVKQKDFLSSIFKMFNLYVDVDPSDINNYLIEPRDDYYGGGTVIDWTNKLAIDSPISIKPMAEIDAKNFIYRYKQDDADYYNKQYFDSYNEPYGTYKKIITNDFTKKDSITDLIFSATLSVDNSNNTLIIPKIFAYDGTVVKPQKHNIRILRYNGKQTITSGTWNYVAPSSDALGAATLAESSYPASGMVDDPLTPTVSIEFGVPNEVFYSLGSTYTTNNLYNRFYSKFLTEITDRDSKIVTAYFKLDASDIAKFDFRNTFFIKDCYYYVNKIMDYDPIKEGLTKVELLKIKNADAYVATSVAVGSISTNIGNTGMTSRIYGESSTETNIGNANNVIIGDNNSSRSVASFISGSKNNVSTDSYRVSIISSDNNNVMESCSGVSLLGCSGINVGRGCSEINLMNCYDLTIADFTYNLSCINVTNRTFTASDSGQVAIQDLASSKVKTDSKTADFTGDPDIDTYYIACSGGSNLTATLNVTQFSGRVVKFIRTDSNGTSFIINSNGGNISGNAFPYTTSITQYGVIKVMCDGSNLFII